MWLLIAIFAILLAILMKISSDKSYSWNKIIFDIIRLLTSQDVKIFELTKFIFKVQNKTTTFIIMIILIFFTVIITKCFLSLLLNSYFKLIKVTVVDSLEELIDGNQCLIASRNKSIISLEHFKMFKEKQIEVLREKKEKYEQIVQMDMNDNGVIYGERVFIDMVEGKTIILENTIVINFIVETFKRDRDRFVISDRKYINQLAGHRINEISFIKEQLIFGFVSNIFIRLVHLKR